MIKIGNFFGGKYRKLFGGTVAEITELSSNQKKVDDRAMFHINSGVVRHRIQLVLVGLPNTYIFVFDIIFDMKVVV